MIDHYSDAGTLRMLLAVFFLLGVVAGATIQRWICEAKHDR